MTELLSLKNVGIAIKETTQQIVTGVDITVYPGRTTVLLGESGSGKTMLVKAITGILNRSHMSLTGNAFYHGTDLFALSEKERRRWSCHIALIMQNPMTSFDPSLKIGKQMVPETRGRKSDATQKAVHVLEAVGLPRPKELLNSYPYELSGGMLQRVMIAIAMMQSASVIVADEPTTALDVVNQELVLNELNGLRKTGVGILLITHDFHVAKKCADYITVMRDGHIVESGEAKKVLERPQSDYTKALLDASTLRRKG